MLDQGRAAAQEEPTPRVAATPDVRAEPAEARASWGTRILPSLHRFLKSEVLRLEYALDRRVKVESVVEALLQEYQADPALRARVQERVRRE